MLSMGLLFVSAELSLFFLLPAVVALKKKLYTIKELPNELVLVILCAWVFCLIWCWDFGSTSKLQSPNPASRNMLGERFVCYSMNL